MLHFPRILSKFALVSVLLAGTAIGQQANTSSLGTISSPTNADMGKAAQKTALQNSAKALQTEGATIGSKTNVKDNVQVQAVLLPGAVAARVFGNEIAQHYAVVQVVVANQSEDSSFILQSLFLDSSKWLFSGLDPTVSPCIPPPGLTQFQWSSCAGQISSVEYRVIRGELQDASTWTVRNGLVRAATLVGSVAAGVPAFASKNAVKYVSAYNGELVPGLEIFWPDPTIAQLNHVSDLGYQTNKVFPKASADVVYGFFPLDRILTPRLKRVFLSSPALFMYPSELFIDDDIGRKSCFMRHYCTTQSDIDSVRDKVLTFVQSSLQPGSTTIRDEGLRLLACPSDAKPGPCDETQLARAQLLRSALDRISINRITVIVGGMMAVNTAILPATVDSLVVDDDNTASTWTATATSCASLSGTVTGRYLTNAEATVTKITLPNGIEAKPGDYFDALPFATSTDSATDSTFKFTAKLKNTIPTGTSLMWAVVKSTTNSDGKNATVQSSDHLMNVTYTGGVAAPSTLLTTACKDR